MCQRVHSLNNYGRDAAPCLWHRTDTGSATAVLAAHYEIASCCKGDGKPLPFFSKRESCSGETSPGQLLLERSVGVSEGNKQPGFNWRLVNAMEACAETLADLLVVFQKHPGAKQISFIL